MRSRVEASRLRVPAAAALSAVLALAAVVRVVSYLQVRDGSILYFHLAADTDMRFYDGWAREVAAGDLPAAEVHHLAAPGQPFDGPLYVHALAASYRLLGPRLWPVLAWQALLGLGTVAFVFTVARTMWDENAALAAATLAALYAPFVFFESALLGGTMQAFLTMAAVASATVGLRRSSPWAWMGAGCAAGLAVLAHAASLLLALALPLAAGNRRRAGCLAAYAAGLALAASPLVARNVVTGQPPWSMGTAAVGPILARTDAPPPPTHPGLLSWPGLMGERVLAFFDGWENEENVNFYYFLLQSPALRAIGVRLSLLLPLAALGFALATQGERSTRWERLASPAALAVACGLITALVFSPSSRVRLGAAAAMIPFAGAGIVEAARRVRGRQWRSLAAPVTTAVVAAVVAAAPWWPRAHLVRELDYRTGNGLAVARWQHERQQGRPRRGLRVLEKQLATEPRSLRALAPEGVTAIPEWAARVAGSFAELHRAAMAAQVEAGRPERALPHAEHARMLSIVAQRYGARAGG